MFDTEVDLLGYYGFAIGGFVHLVGVFLDPEEGEHGVAEEVADGIPVVS